jgi:hypothetical protein
MIEQAAIARYWIGIVIRLVAGGFIATWILFGFLAPLHIVFGQRLFGNQSFQWAWMFRRVAMGDTLPFLLAGILIIVFRPRLVKWLCPIPKATCIECGYDLRHLEGAVCSECGTPVPFAHSSSGDSRRGPS